jgi:hypothetical protein
MKISNQFIGSAGVFFAMASLSARGFHASITHGNAPFIDIVISSEKGENHLLLKLKRPHTHNGGLEGKKST